MRLLHPFRSRAAGLWRALWPVLVVVAGAVTCDSPTSLGHRASLAIAPVFGKLSLSGFSGMTVDSVRLTVIRPPSTIVTQQTLAFSADSSEINAQLNVQLTSSHEQLVVRLEFLSGSQVLFTGADTLDVTAGTTTPTAATIQLSYIGPGNSIASIHIAPRDTGVITGAAVPYVLTATDTANQAVTQFYAHWSTSRASDTINALGVLRAGSIPGIGWVFARTPTGIVDSTSVTVSAPTQAGTPATIIKVAGDGQVATAGTAVPAVPRVRVLDGQNVRVAGVQVLFAVTSGGGTVVGGTVTTDSGGFAQPTSWTLGAAVANNTLTASLPAFQSVTPQVFGATGIAVAPIILLTVPGNVIGVGGTAPLLIRLLPTPGSPVTVTVTSDSTQFVTVAQPGTVSFAAGDTLKTITLNGVMVGGSIVRATAPGYTAGITVVGVTPNVILLQSPLTVGVGQNATDSIHILPAAPAAGLAIALVSTDTTILRVTTPIVTIPAGQSSGVVTVHGVAAGIVGMLATATGYADGGAVVTVTAATGGAIASTTVTPRLDTLTALTDTVAIFAQAKDGAGVNVAGTFTFVSRTPSVATVTSTNAVGHATAVANGSTWVVATEAGGTKDSTLVVVQQRLATINVTPGTRNIYLSRNFTFTAAAVDGRGHPVAGISTFTWTTTAPAVASVDTAHTATNLVTALGLGTAQIKATSGLVTGVSNVSVLTPITRIAVVVDTALAFKTDTFTLTSLGLTRQYRAVAHDTLDAVMTGVTFTWASTNGSVALDSTTGTATSTATSAANGVTSIKATAQGFTSAPGAYLTVAQALASIELKPDTNNPTATIAPLGTMHVSARGKDANNRYISGGTFIYHSSTPGFATVDSLTGLVTGVSQGADTVTATSGAITSNKVIVTVSNGGPAIISFGRDTLSVGRGNSQAFPILLSRPDTAPMIVKLTAPAFAHWQTPTVTIAQGSTSINATLVGDSAGTTTVTATDSSRHLFAGGSAVAKVTANMHLGSSGYAINTTDIQTTQVLLSDPSPAGGTYVTFNYSTPGVASISPDPAFIPQGQLAADIQIRAVGAGTTIITPNAIGVNGTASSFTAFAPVLTPSTSFIRLGQGQFDPGTYVQTPTYTNIAVPVTITSSDTNVVTVTPAVTIPGGSYYAYITVTAKGIGSATITVSAPGWTAAHGISVVSQPPRIGISGGGQLNTTSPAQNVTVFAEDSVGNGHYRVNSLVVHLGSTNPTVMQVLDSVVTIAPGQSYTSAGRVKPAGVLGGTAYIVATASGHQPDSVLYTVVGPKLHFNGIPSSIGAGQYDPNAYISTPDYLTAPLVVSVSNSNPTSVTVPSVDTIPQGSYYRYFNTLANAPGAATFIGSATGYTPDTGFVLVTTPRITASGNTTLNNFSAGTYITVYSTDSAGYGHSRIAPLAVSVTSLNTGVVTVDSATVHIDSSRFYNIYGLHVTPVDTGTAKIVFAATGHISKDTVTIRVNTPKLYISLSHYAPSPTLLGQRQHLSPDTTGFYVSTPNARGVPVPVTITQKHSSVDALTRTNPTIQAGTYYAYLDAYGLANGGDTLIVSATGYLPDTAYIAVTTPRLTNSGLPGSTTTTNPPIGIYVYATDSVANGHYTGDTLVVRAVTSDSNIIRPAQQFFRILKNTSYTFTTVNIVGPGTAHMTYSDSAGTGYDSTMTGTITVIGPSLGLQNGSGGRLGMRQTDGGNSYVYTPNPVATPLVVHLLSTGTRVATVPDSVIVLAGTYYTFFQVTAQDTVGTIQIQASALGYGPPVPMTVQVTQPKFVMGTSATVRTTNGRQGINVYAADAFGAAHPVAENVTVTLLSSAQSVASLDTTVTILAGQYLNSSAGWQPGTVGTAQLTASDARSAYYRYDRDTANVRVVTPALSFSWSSASLGIGQYSDNVYVQTPDYQVAPVTIAFSHSGTAHVATDSVGTNIAITSVTIPASNYYRYFRIAGVSAGTDSLVANLSSPAHAPDTAYTVVGQGRVDPISNWPTSIKAGDSVQVTLYARDSAQTVHYVVAATTFTLAPNANIQFVSGGVAGASMVITSVTVPADQQSVSFWVKGVAQGSGSVAITNANYQTYNNTVTVTP